MVEITSRVNEFFSFIATISDFLWDYPTGEDWYMDIPIIGNISFAILLLVGSGIFFTFYLGFVQVKYFGKSFKVLLRKNIDQTGLSPLAAFLLSSATRVGPGNIMGVTGAVIVGGPGALFWMWFSAFFGMTTSFVEATLAQIFKEQKDDTFVGGIAYYGRRLIKNSKVVGVLIAIAYIVYALFTLPGQVFHMFTALGGVATQVTGVEYGRTSGVYIIIGLLIIFTTIPIIFGGIKRVAKVTDVLVPVMAIVYFIIGILLILVNLNLVPLFFSSVFKGAFSPEAIFGGAFGIALQQGIKRGLMSNEAGQGTITMAAAASNAKHPVEQGFIQSFGVFVDTFVICTVTGFLVVIASLWTNQPEYFAEITGDKLANFNGSIEYLTPGFLGGSTNLIMTLCYAMFAFSTIIGMIAFIDICSNEISRDKRFNVFIKLLSAGVFVPFGVLCVWANLELGNIWYISDLVNLMMVIINIPLLYLGIKLVKKTLKHYEEHGGENFNGSVIGMELDYWDQK